MSLRVRFLIAVNLTLLVTLSVFLFMDFRYQWSTHLEELSADTKREAELLVQAVQHLGSSDHAAMQSLVDTATETLRAGEPARRDFIAIDAGDTTLLPSDNRISTTHANELIRQVSDDASAVARDWSIGEAVASDRRVYVFRNLVQARAFTTEHMLWRLAEVALLGLLATVLINVLLMHLVIRPFIQLAGAIRRLREGKYGTITDTFRSREIQSLAADINQMSLALARANRERSFQMSKAGRLQRRLQSDDVAIPGLKVAHWHEAADHVAGDYFDLLQCPDGAWLICIADVTGHGVAAAMGAAVLKTLLWSAVEAGADLDRILRSVNQRFGEATLEEDFASLLVIRWECDSGTLQYASAGHETAFLLVDDETPTLLESTGTLIGIAQDEVWDIRRVAVMPGSRLILYTDGITEATSPSGKLFGRDRLVSVIREQVDTPIQEMTDVVINEVRKHLDGRSADDDLTLVGLEFAGRTDDHPLKMQTAVRGEE